MGTNQEKKGNQPEWGKDEEQVNGRGAKRGKYDSKYVWRCLDDTHYFVFQPRKLTIK